MINKMCVIPDIHCHPQYDNDRLEWLGNLLLETKPDIILCLGDLADMPSLSHFDKGTKGFEGRRYKSDVDVSIDGQEKIFKAINTWNARQSRNRKAQYNPRKIITAGNHCQARVNKAISSQAVLEGTISFDDLKYKEFWDEVYDFKTTAVIEGFAVSHFFATGVMGKSAGGENPADTCLKKVGMSNISGHSHLWDVKIRTRADGKKQMALVAGCYVHPEMVDDWNRNTFEMWHNSITMLHDVEDGYCQGIETYTQDRIKRLYS